MPKNKMLALMKTIFAGESLEMISRLLIIPTTDGRLLLPPPWPCMATKGLDKGDQGGEGHGSLPILEQRKQVRFQQTRNQGLLQLLLTVSWDLRALRGTPDGVFVFL